MLKSYGVGGVVGWVGWVAHVILVSALGPNPFLGDFYGKNMISRLILMISRLNIRV